MQQIMIGYNGLQSICIQKRQKLIDQKDPLLDRLARLSKVHSPNPKELEDVRLKLEEINEIQRSIEKKKNFKLSF